MISYVRNKVIDETAKLKLKKLDFRGLILANGYFSFSFSNLIYRAPVLTKVSSQGYFSKQKGYSSKSKNKSLREISLAYKSKLC